MNAFAVLAETSSDESEVDEVDDHYTPIAVDDGALECRICQEPADLANLIAPCNCAGSVRYVHPACLSAWRSMSVANLTHCNVCNARYNFVQSFSACVREWLSSRAKGLRRAGTWRKMWRRCKAALESGRSPACCAARLAMQSLFLLFSVAQGRLVLLLGAHIWSAVGELDAAVDRAVLPEKLLRTLEGVFPALNAWEGVHSKVFFQSVGSLHVSFTGSDLVVGALFSSLNCHLYSLWCLGRELQPPLLPCPVHDMADLWEMLFPLPEQAASFCGIILPLLIYVGRKLLLWCVGLPMDALELSFITGENLGLHIGLGLGLGAILLLVLEMGDALVHDFATWSSMAERRAVASRGRRGRRRAGAAAAAAAAAGAATG